MTGGLAVEQLTAHAAAERTPLYAMAELTWRCNFRCVHCYQEGLRERRGELSATEWMKVLDELADMGCVFLVLTGGEGILRRDFAEIFGHAVDRGFMVTVFTNGSLIDQELLDLWASKPPRKVEITLYGMSARKYAEVAGCAEGFARVSQTIDRLVEMGIRVELKAPGIRPLVGEFEAMSALATSRGLSFRIDPGIFPRLSGDRGPLAFRLAPDEVVELEASRPGFAESLRACFAQPPTQARDKVYLCGAGVNSLSIDPFGLVVACPLLRGLALDWRGLGAARAWEGLAGEARRVHSPSASTRETSPASCAECSLRLGCSGCPGKSWMEVQDVEAPVAHHCRVAELRRQMSRKSA